MSESSCHLCGLELPSRQPRCSRCEGINSRILAAYERHARDVPDGFRPRYSAIDEVLFFEEGKLRYYGDDGFCHEIRTDERGRRIDSRTFKVEAPREEIQAEMKSLVANCQAAIKELRDLGRGSNFALLMMHSQLVEAARTCPDYVGQGELRRISAEVKQVIDNAYLETA